MESISAVKGIDVKAPGSQPETHNVENQKNNLAKEKSHEENLKLVERGSNLLQKDEVTELEHVAKAIEGLAMARDWSIKIKVDNQSDQTVVQVISKDDGKVIRQFPPDELLNLADKMEEMVGVLINEKA